MFYGSAESPNCAPQTNITPYDNELEFKNKTKKQGEGKETSLAMGRVSQSGHVLPITATHESMSLGKFLNLFVSQVLQP